MIQQLCTEVPVFHLASIARSGETLVLRCLNKHPDLQVVHNLADVDAQHETALFQFLKTFGSTRISRFHELVVPYELNPKQILVLKQAVWEHRYPFEGVILVRNPVASFASLKAYDAPQSGNSGGTWDLNQERLSRWLADIDRDLVPGFSEQSPVDQFALFYNRRMSHLQKTEHPVIRYEDFVVDPIASLKSITAEIGVDFDPRMVHSHEDYSSNSIGHGQNDLGKPIHTDSLLKYTQVLTKNEFAALSVQVSEVAAGFGYNLTWGTSGI